MIRWATASATDPRFVGACGELDRWLSSAELRHLGGLTVVKRRRDWLLGRWTAKGLVMAHLRRDDPCAVSIEAGGDGAPRVLYDGSPLSVSISHSHGHALCAVVDGEAPVGVDLEWIEPRSDAFVTDFFTAAEAAQVRGARGTERDRLVTATWSAKEAALKVLRTGLTVDTRSVTCRAEEGGGGWSALQYGARGEGLRGWWRTREGFVVCLAVG